MRRTGFTIHSEVMPKRIVPFTTVIRPLGPVFYLWPPLVTGEKEQREQEAINVINKLRYKTDEYPLYIPYAECWYPEDMPLAYISSALLVDIYEDAPDILPGLVLHNSRLEEQDNARK